MHRPPLALLIALTTLTTCRDVNRDHCLHRAPDPDAWCALNAPAAPHCSPCVINDDHGCVTEPPPPTCPETETETE